MQNRSIRRHHLKRVKNRVKHFRCFAYTNQELSEKTIGRAARTRCACSCPMCGNQRRNDWQSRAGRLTMQERRHEEDMEFGLEEQCQEN